jgi:hypothetical protein
MIKDPALLTFSLMLWLGIFSTKKQVHSNTFRHFEEKEDIGSQLLDFLRSSSPIFDFDLK